MSDGQTHIAIIPDGNRRWAKAHALEAFFGHEAGAKAVESILNEALKKNIQYLTL